MKADLKPIIYFLPDAKYASVDSENMSLLDVALRHKVRISHTCDGNATCGTCLVRVIEGEEFLNSRNEWEQEMAESRGYSENERLACQCHCTGPVKVQVMIKE